MECIKNGAFDYLIKPFSDEQIGVTLRKAEEFIQLVRVNRLLSQETDESEHNLLGNSPDMENLRQLIRKVARTHATVLIQGESGTGKEADRPRALPPKPARPRAVHQGQLRRHSGKPDRKRIFRPRKRRVHRRVEQTRRPF